MGGAGFDLELHFEGLELCGSVLEDPSRLEELLSSWRTLARELVLEELEGSPLGSMGPRALEASVVFLARDEMAEMNARYRGKEGPTDVLSFPTLEWGLFDLAQGFEGLGEEPLPLGDVFICPEVARENALSGGTSTERELTLLLIHGLCHLLGHDHDEPEREARMWAVQGKYMERFLRGSGGVSDA